MRQFRIWGLLLLIPALGFLVVTPGCSKKDKDKTEVKKDSDKDEDDDGGKDGGGDETTGARTELETTGWGTLTGKATLVGSVPTPKPEEGIAKSDDAKVCKAGLPEEKVKQGWKVRKKDKSVANVVVWIQPPDGKFFKLPPKKDWPEEWTNAVQINQPHCAFVPHVATAWPKYYDAKKKGLVASGQKFEILNSAPMPHNTRITGNEKYNAKWNQTLPKKSGDKPTVRVVPINPQPGSPLNLNCDIHKWMNGKVWVFDHPYAAVTKGDHVEDRDEDETFGTFEIKNVPTGKEVRLFAWHEEAGYLTPPGGQKITLKKGENKHNFQVEAK
jgi:hypothetical protein